MKINLKTTVLFSVALAILMNIWQFVSSYQQREAAFAPSWAYAASSTTTNTASAAKLAPLPAAPPASTASAAALPAAVAAPESASVATVASALLSAGLKPDYAALYLSVQQQTNTPWQLLAAVHEVETGQSGSTSRSSSAGATGPMQFMPATFNHYAADGNGDGIRDITNVSDAMLTAGRYLAADGAAQGRYENALFGYNHSSSYVSRVLGIANRLGL